MYGDKSQLPDSRFIDLAFKVFDQNERDELLLQLLTAAFFSLQNGSVEPIRRVLFAWEYTALWKKDPQRLAELESEDDESGSVDWQEFLNNEGGKN